MTSDEIERLFKVQTFDQVSASPVEKFATILTAELMEAGHVRYQSWHWEQRAIALMDSDGMVAAAIVFEYQKFSREVFVALGGTGAAFRRAGLYGYLFRQLCDHVRETIPQAQAISSGYGVNNAASAAMHASLGRAVTGHTTRFPLRG